MGRPLAWLVRLFSYLFHTILGFFQCGLALLALAGGKHNLRVDLLPWEGKGLTSALAALGLFALLSVVLAMTGRTRLLLMIQAAGTVVVLVRGLFLSPMPLNGNPVDLSGALWLTGSALVALAGAFAGSGRRRG